MLLKTEPEKSVILRLVILLVGIQFLCVGIVMATKLHWVALLLIPLAGLILWGWWLARQQSLSGTPPWPADIPRLYPELDGVELCEFMSAQRREEIKRFPIIYILPFVSEDSSEKDACFGAGLQRMLIRNLMQVRNISVHGPEDTPVVFLGQARGLAESDERSPVYVTGKASYDADGYRLDLEIFRPGKPWAKGSVTADQLDSFLYKCAATIAKAVGGQVDSSIVEKWKIARPSSAESLTELGRLRLMADEVPEEEKAAALIRLFEKDPSFALPAGEIDSDLPQARQWYLRALERDPYDAQTYFSLFCRVFEGGGWNPAAMQLARRGIELSPGHGKAHMCAPHAAHPDADMLGHSELGYLLLPGNTFAIRNYTINLTNAGASHEQLMDLAKEGISADPFDPGNYAEVISLFYEANQFRAALAVAKDLQTLFEPAMDERTLYCLKQSPVVAQAMETGQYDPAEANRQLIAQLEAAVQQTGRSARGIGNTHG